MKVYRTKRGTTSSLWIAFLSGAVTALIVLAAAVFDHLFATPAIKIFVEHFR